MQKTKIGLIAFAFVALAGCGSSSDSSSSVSWDFTGITETITCQSSWDTVSLSGDNNHLTLVNCQIGHMDWNATNTTVDFNNSTMSSFTYTGPAGGGGNVVNAPQPVLDVIPDSDGFEKNVI